MCMSLCVCVCSFVCVRGFYLVCACLCRCAVSVVDQLYVVYMSLDMCVTSNSPCFTLIVWPVRADEETAPAAPAVPATPIPTVKGKQGKAPIPSRASPPPSPFFQFQAVGIVLLAAWLLYVFGFHYLANLPVDAPMPRGVLARFWMQADVLTAVVFGVGIACLQWGVDRLLAATHDAEIGGPRLGVASPTRKLGIVFVVIVVGLVATRLPAVDHGAHFKQL